MPSAQGRNAPVGEQGEQPALDRVLLDAARGAAAVIRDAASGLGAIVWEHKGPADFVSDVDRAAESVTRDTLLGAYPDAAFLGEETYEAADRLGDGLAFVVDPLDGTSNFLHGFPWYAVSIGATVAGEPVAGVVLNVATGETFTATRGGGAFRDGKPIAVSSIDNPARALIGTGFPFKNVDRLDEYLRQFAIITREAAGIRRPGSAALDLCDVACGRFDAFWELTLAPWDIAAGMLIVREAGGIVTDLDGAPARVGHTTIAAGNPTMHRWMLDVVRRAK